MAKITSIILIACLVATSIELAQSACTTCFQPALDSCDNFVSYVSCLGSVAISSACTTQEKATAAGVVLTTKATMAIFGCSGVSGLLPSLGLALTLSGIAYLFNSKH